MATAAAATRTRASWRGRGGVNKKSGEKRVDNNIRSSCCATRGCAWLVVYTGGASRDTYRPHSAEQREIYLIQCKYTTTYNGRSREKWPVLRSTLRQDPCQGSH